MAQPECRAFLKQDHITYVQPVVDWRPAMRSAFYPEAAGRYALRIQRRDPDGSTGWTEAAVRVVGAPEGLMPSLVNLDRQTRLWTPTPREAPMIARYEPETADLIRARVRSVVYDIGANIGFYSVLPARLVGTRGHVYCVEANPVCVYFLAERVCEFVINPANSLVGVAGDSPYAVRPGQKVLLPGLALDELIDRFELRPPDFLKIDIEGAEITAIRGMRGTLERDRPLLLIELHGRVVARETLAHIADLGYHLSGGVLATGVPGCRRTGRLVSGRLPSSAGRAAVSGPPPGQRGAGASMDAARTLDDRSRSVCQFGLD